MSAVLSSSAPPSASPAPLRHPHLLLWAVCALALMSTAGVALPYPILAPIFVGGPVDDFTHFLGLRPELLMGLALAVNPAGILVGSLFVGPMSDRYGRRRVLGITITATLVGYGLSAFALASRDYPLFVLSRFATGLTEGNVAVVRALLADWHPQLERTRSFAWLNASLYIGWLVGPLLGGLTLPWGEAVPFIVAAVVLVPCLVLLGLGLPDDRPRRGRRAACWRRCGASSRWDWWCRTRCCGIWRCCSWPIRWGSMRCTSSRRCGCCSRPGWAAAGSRWSRRCSAPR